MISIASIIRVLAQEAEKPSAGRSKYVPEKVTVFFSAPDKPSVETPSGEGNFQWTRYELLFREETFEKGKLVKAHHYIYKTPLWPWGDESPGGQEVVDANPKITEIDLSPEEVKRGLPKILRGPNLYPPGLQGFYVNTHKSAVGKEYTYGDFDKKFRKSGFYKVITKSKKEENP